MRYRQTNRNFSKSHFVKNMKPDTSTLPEHLRRYISHIEDDDITEAYQNHSKANIQFYQAISEQQSGYRYATDKWTIKEVLQHVIDTERVFCYRALVFARGDQTALPGFDENLYTRNAHANDRPWQGLVQEYKSVCGSTMSLINSFNDDDYSRTGIASSHSVSVLAMLFAIVGHASHHVRIIKERYLKGGGGER